MSNTKSNKISLGAIGGGVMAEAILSRLISREVYTPETIVVSEPNAARREFWQQQYQVRVTDSNQTVATDAEVLLLAIKPQVLSAVVADLSSQSLQSSQLVISILAGVSLSTLETSFAQQPVIRAMPNTPATVGMGITAIAPGKLVTNKQLQVAKKIFAAVGKVVEVPEYQMDAVTALSGSGPAYVAMVVEALADGGVKAGLPRAIALELALETVLGTAQLLSQSELHPAVLKDRVSSPGGTTIAGVASLEKAGFRSALIEAVQAAYLRAIELGKN